MLSFGTKWVASKAKNYLQSDAFHPQFDRFSAVLSLSLELKLYDIQTQHPVLPLVELPNLENVWPYLMKIDYFNVFLYCCEIARSVHAVK